MAGLAKKLIHANPATDALFLLRYILDKGGTIKTKISITINEKTLKDIDSIIDNIYIRNRSQAIEHLVQTSLGENRVAVILSGGIESKQRINGEYRATAPLGDLTVIERAVKKLKKSGFRTIFFVSRSKILTRAFEIMKDGSKYGVSMNYIEEKDSKGSADTLRLIKGRVNSHFLVVFSDLIFD